MKKIINTTKKKINQLDLESKFQIFLIIWSLFGLYNYLKFFQTFGIIYGVQYLRSIYNKFWFFNGDIEYSYDLTEFLVYNIFPWIGYYLYKKFFSNEN
jgi:hypothetical protein